MKNLSHSFVSKLISYFVVTIFLFSQNMVCGFAYADIVKPTTKIKHKPVEYFVPGKRIVLNAGIKDKQGIEIARCYFRAQGEADFVFVQMTQTEAGIFRAILPAPTTSTEAIDYVFLAVNSEKQVVKTQKFTIPKKANEDKAPIWQQTGSEGNIIVKTELAEAPSQLAGFSDSIIWDVVESSERFGVVAGGLYSAISSGAAATTITTGTGTVTASAGISTLRVVAIGAAAVAAGVAGAAIASSSGGDDDNNSPDETICFEGTWSVNIVSSYCPSLIASYTVTYEATDGYITSVTTSGGEYINAYDCTIVSTDDPALTIPVGTKSCYTISELQSEYNDFDTASISTNQIIVNIDDMTVTMTK